jgi:DNA-binding transcriptional LysR family regulator
VDIHQLKLFSSVYKNRSFSRASEEMSLTQPTISDHIRSLESELGCRLFDRLGRTIVPTKEAETLYAHAVELIEKAEAVKEVIEQVKSSPSGELIVGASTIPGSYMLPFLMASFKHKYPDIVFQIIIGDSKDIIGKLLSHELLLGIVGALIPDDKLSYTHIAEDELIIISSPNFMKKNTISLEELLDVPFVLREEGSGTRMEIERILMAHAIDINALKTVGVFGTTTGVKQAVKSGMGLSIVSRFAARDHLKSRALKEIKVPDLQMKRNFYIVTHKKRSLPTAFSLFVEHIAPEIKKLLRTHS